VYSARREGSKRKESFCADLVVIADGCFSNFRSTVMGSSASVQALTVRGNLSGGRPRRRFTLPIPQHGTVALVKGHGPVLLYQIGQHDTRILIDVKKPRPIRPQGAFKHALPATLCRGK
jgi:squalene monooxygenase